MKDLSVTITRTDARFSDLTLPAYATPGSAGMDVYAAIEDAKVIVSGEIALIPTALAISLPMGYECQVRSRSGLAAKNGVFCLNSPGTIDSDYRGEIKVILANFGTDDFVLKRGDRIAQLVVAAHERVAWLEVELLDETLRGGGGFGSTGTGATQNLV